MTPDPEGFIRAGAHLWSPSERFHYVQCLAYTWKGCDTFCVEGTHHRFWVIPMVKALSNPKSREPRRPWHTGNQRRPRYWAVVKTEMADGPASLWLDHWQLPTQSQAKEKADELAREDKVLALLHAN